MIHLLDKEATLAIEKRVGHTFKDKTLLSLAFTHSSYVNEQSLAMQHNERLEFLGDAVLELIISNYLYRHLHTLPEGLLSPIKSQLVEASACTMYMQKLHLHPFLLISKGEQKIGHRGKNSILADLFEALMGALYLDGGIDVVTHFFFKNFSQEIEAFIKEPKENFKAKLQDFCQKKLKETPRYEVLSQQGPDHQKHFQMHVLCAGSLLGMGVGRSKKEGEQNAAKDAIERLNI
jgi:ribonuclease III